jgi:hypothetical protein
MVGQAEGRQLMPSEVTAPRCAFLDNRRRAVTDWILGLLAWLAFVFFKDDCVQVPPLSLFLSSVPSFHPSLCL